MRRLYRYQAPIYDRSRWAFLHGRRRACELLAPRAGESILDLGCGTGRWLPSLAKKVGPEGRIVGIDCVSKLLDRARSRCRDLPMVQLIEANWLEQDLPLPRIDAVLLSYSLSMIDDWQGCLRRLEECLAPEGRVVVVDFLHCSTPGLSWLFRQHGVQFGPERREELRSRFGLTADEERRAYASAWSWYLFAGRRCAKAQ
jgi:S-adenosylmethionine-diacylgycerolhomoserine-N-methlytransferase